MVANNVRQAQPEHEPGHYRTVARVAAHHLLDRGCARVILEPGDATRYELAILAPGPTATAQPNVWQDLTTYWWVALLRFGRGYPWNGHEVDWTYAAEKWTDDHEHTAKVMAAFLSALAAAIGEV